MSENSPSQVDSGVRGEAPRTAREPRALPNPFADFDEIFTQRLKEADEFYDAVIPSESDDEAKNVARQGYAGLLWSKQFYHYFNSRMAVCVILQQPAPPPERHFGRNREWTHLFNRDVISMPDKWEYPWFAAWDLAFHVARWRKSIDILPRSSSTASARMGNESQRTDSLHTNFISDVNPPTHAWAAGVYIR